MVDLERLEAMLATTEPGPWVDHSGGGRPHPPTTFVEVQYRRGTIARTDSAMVRWPWYDDDQPAPMDVMRWREVKRPPTDRDLAAFVRPMLARIRELETPHADQ